VRERCSCVDVWEAGCKRNALRITPINATTCRSNRRASRDRMAVKCLQQEPYRETASERQFTKSRTFAKYHGELAIFRVSETSLHECSESLYAVATSTLVSSFRLSAKLAGEGVRRLGELADGRGREKRQFALADDFVMANDVRCSTRAS
jgi:hypothetical protein